MKRWKAGCRGWRRRKVGYEGGWVGRMDTQKGAHGCATTTPVLQTPQLPGTATARPEVTRLLPTVHLLSLSDPPFLSLSHPLCLSFSLCFSPLPLIYHPFGSPSSSNARYPVLASSSHRSTSFHHPPPLRRRNSHTLPCHLHAYTWCTRA